MGKQIIIHMRFFFVRYNKRHQPVLPTLSTCYLFAILVHSIRDISLQTANTRIFEHLLQLNVVYMYLIYDSYHDIHTYTVIYNMCARLYNNSMVNIEMLAIIVQVNSYSLIQLFLNMLTHFVLYVALETVFSIHYVYFDSLYFMS